MWGLAECGWKISGKVGARQILPACMKEGALDWCCR
jgi:hypothetical protein